MATFLPGGEGNLGSGPPGTLVTVYGTGFTNDITAVYFGAVSCGSQFAVISDTTLVAYAPAGTGTVHVTVVNPAGTSSTSGYDEFTYSAYEGPPAPPSPGNPPTVTSVVPSSAIDNDGGDEIVVNGTNFTTTQVVLFDDVQAQFSVTSDTALAVTTPAGSGTVDIVVINDYGASSISAADEFTYPVGLIPTITSFTPTSAGEWAPVVITGTNFLTPAGATVVTNVTFTGTGATEITSVFRIDSATSLTAYVPEAAITGPIKLYSEAGSATSSTFTSLGSVYGFVQASASGKNSIHYDSSPPGVTPNIVGDTWFRYGTGINTNNIIEQYIGRGGTAWQSVSLASQVIAFLDAGKLTAGTVAVGIGLTSPTINSAVITGGTIQTASSGTRVQIIGGQSDRITWADDYASSREALGSDSVSSAHSIIGPERRTNPQTAPCQFVLSSQAAVSKVDISANGALVTVGSVASTVAISGSLFVSGWVVAGRVQSDSFQSGTSVEGVFIQDSITTSARWKIYFNSSQNLLYIRKDNDVWHRFTPSSSGP